MTTKPIALYNDASAEKNGAFSVLTNCKNDAFRVVAVSVVRGGRSPFRSVLTPRFLSIALLATALFFASNASASPYEMYGAGIQNAAMGTTLTAASDYGATYYNPAALPEVKPMLAAGVFANYSSAGISLMERPNGYDIPDLGTASPALPSRKELQTRWSTKGPQSIIALTLGATYNFGMDSFNAGISLFVPLNSLVRMSTHFNDERERYFHNALSWELIDQRVERLDIEAGVGYRVLDWLSIGINGSFLPGAAANMMTYVPDPTDQGNILISSDVEPTAAWSVGGGFLLSLPWDLRLAFTGRTSLEFDVIGKNRLQVRSVAENGDISQVIKWRPVYTPPNLSFGLSWESKNILIELGGRYTFWHNYLDTNYEPGNFHDTFDIRLGGKYVSSQRNSFMFGLGYVPTPVPDQTGRTNYVDNSRLIFSFGGTHKFSITEYPIEIGWAGQFHLLVKRHTRKKMLDHFPDCKGDRQRKSICDEVSDKLTDSSTGAPLPAAQGLQTGNPGFPGWTSGGVIASLQVELRL